MKAADIGLIGTKAVNELGGNGLLVSGSPSLLTKQVIAILATAAYSFTATFIIAKVIQKTIGFRVRRDVELEGLDTTTHAESAYDINPFTSR